MSINEYPIVILHGWGSSSKRWEMVKQSLGEKGYSVFVPDLPGFGDNPPPQNSWGVEDYAEWVKKWSEEQNLAGFCLVGHSFGGSIAALFTAKYSEKVAKLILVAPAIRRRKTFKTYAFFIISKLGRVVFSFPLLSFFYPLFQRILYKVIGVSDYLVASLRSPIMKETFQKIIAEDLSPYLSRISAQTLLIWGDKDRITPLSDAYFIKQRLKNANLEIIRGARHSLNIEAPEKLAEIIDTFLNPKP